MISLWLIILLLTATAVVFVVKPLLIGTHLPKNSSNYMTAIAIAILLPLSAICLYLHWGDSKEVAEWLFAKKHAAQVKTELGRYGSRQSVITALKNRLEQLPKDINSARGWYILGKLYLTNKEEKLALSAFHEATILNPGEQEYLLQYVGLKFLSHKNTLDEDDREMLSKVLKTNPDNVNAINLLALDAYQSAQYGQAIKYWERLLKYFSPDSSDEKSLLEMINLAQSKLVSASSSVKISITVNLSISEKLKNKISKEDSVFVYALDPHGTKIPLAVVKRAASELPCTIVLDDSQAMLPGHSLSTVSKVLIEARVSKTGNAIAADGDLLGRSSEMAVRKHNQLYVEINQIYSK